MKLIRILLLSLLVFSSHIYAADVKDRDASRVDVRNDGGANVNDVGTDTPKHQKPEPARNSGIQQCKGEFALCASSTCKPTGRMIKVNIADGKSTKEYPEVICKCPIITAEIANANGADLSGIAGVNQGNMKGSCAVPSPDKIWSLFAPLTNYPQESATPPFVKGDSQNTFKQAVCSSGVGSNCWSFLCTRDKALTNGTRTATCACPAGENPFGAPTQNSQFLIGAGSQYTAAQGGQQAACSQYPVSVPNIADYK
jgi:hypothetical protein